MELRRAYRTQESLVRYWAEQAVDLCVDIEDESLEEYAEPVRAAMQALQHDRRIIVIGGEGSGKSTVLAAIAGVPTIARCHMDGLYLCWRSVCRDGDASHSRFLPLPWLDGLELVDTAACDGPAGEICPALLQGADVVVAVVDARAPEASPVWDILAELPQQALASCLLAITFSDLLQGEGAVTLKSTLQELFTNRLKTPLPTYTLLPGREDGAGALRTRVGEILREPHTLRAAIRGLAERAIDLVDKQSRVLRVRHSASLTDRSFISTIDHEIDNFLSHQMLGIGTHQSNLNNAVMKVIPPVLRKIRSSLGWTLSPTALLRLELMGADTDRSLYRQMEEKVQVMQAEFDKQFTLSCAGHWRHVRPRMKMTLDFEIGEFPEADLEEELAELRKRLCRDLYEPFASTKLRHSFFRLFIAQAGWMRACMVFLCFLLAAGGALGFIGQDLLGFCCVGAAALVWLGGSIGHHLAYRHICKEVTRLTDALRVDMESSMRSVLEQLIVSRVTAYRQLYTKPRQKVARRDDMLKPLQEKQKSIHIQLRTLLPRL